MTDRASYEDSLDELREVLAEHIVSSIRYTQGLLNQVGIVAHYFTQFLNTDGSMKPGLHIPGVVAGAVKDVFEKSQSLGLASFRSSFLGDKDPLDIDIAFLENIKEKFADVGVDNVQVTYHTLDGATNRVGVFIPTESLNALNRFLQQCIISGVRSQKIII